MVPWQMADTTILSTPLLTFILASCDSLSPVMSYNFTHLVTGRPNLELISGCIQWKSPLLRMVERGATHPSTNASPPPLIHQQDAVSVLVMLNVAVQILLYLESKAQQPPHVSFDCLEC